jgi:hypothetical protein
VTAQVYVEPIDFTVPAGTPASSPYSVPLDIGDALLRKVDCRIPPGHNGATGFQIQSNNVYIVPWSSTPTWIIASDEHLVFEWDDEIDSQVSINGYNVGNYDHTFYLRIFYTPMALTFAGQSLTVVQAPIS